MLRRAFMAGVLVLSALVGSGCGDAGDGATDDSGLVADTTERGAFTVALMAPPGGFRRGRNSFSVVARDAHGHLASLTEVVARMPSHTHVEAMGQPLAAGDAWRVDDLVLPMAGRWEITLRFEAGDVDDHALVVTRLQ